MDTDIDTDVQMKEAEPAAASASVADPLNADLQDPLSATSDTEQGGDSVQMAVGGRRG